MVRINIGSSLFGLTGFGWVSGGSWEWVLDPIVRCELPSDNMPVSVPLINVDQVSENNEVSIGRDESTKDDSSASGAFVLPDAGTVLARYETNAGPPFYLESADITGDIWGDKSLDKDLRIEKATKFKCTWPINYSRNTRLRSISARCIKP